mmetsp:Transcript_5760/g.14282  ORF Transcript_5760/g.14282 Transcript_5760/m.14282 type:complete len:206 (-) Transcript_5760:337-954(-)
MLMPDASPEGLVIGPESLVLVPLSAREHARRARIGVAIVLTLEFHLDISEGWERDADAEYGACVVVLEVKPLAHLATVHRQKQAAFTALYRRLEFVHRALQRLRARLLHHHRLVRLQLAQHPAPAPLVHDARYQRVPREKDQHSPGDHGSVSKQQSAELVRHLVAILYGAREVSKRGRSLDVQLASGNNVRRLDLNGERHPQLPL